MHTRKKQVCVGVSERDCYHLPPQGGINAGVVVLSPSAIEFGKMLAALQDRKHRCHIASSGPEQDFLTRWFDEKWYSFPKKYNWQLHQVENVHADKDLNCDRFMIDYEDLRILHFSTEDKPASSLFPSHSTEEFKYPVTPNMLVRQWILRVLFSQHQ